MPLVRVQWCPSDKPKPVFQIISWPFLRATCEHLKHEGTLHSSSDLLKICVKMGASWSAQDFRQTGVTPSGPGAFLLLFFLKTWSMSFSLIRRCELN